MRSAVCWLNFVGRPVGFGALEAFTGVMAPLTSVLAFGVLVGFLAPFLMVSGITRIPSVNVE